MLRTLAHTLCAAALVAAAGLVLLAGPLTANPAVSIVPPFTRSLPGYLLSIAN